MGGFCPESKSKNYLGVLEAVVSGSAVWGCFEAGVTGWGGGVLRFCPDSVMCKDPIPLSYCRILPMGYVVNRVEGGMN